METYWNILEKVKGSSLRLTKFDDDIYAHFKKDFPEIDVSGTLDQDALKSKEGKERWRKFMNEYENKVDDYNFGTMLRDSPKAEYGPDTTMMSVRMQFYAIEIARLVTQCATVSDVEANGDRNRGGHNDWIYEKAHAK
jgi:hypothetical protein